MTSAHLKHALVHSWEDTYGDARSMHA